MIRHEDVIYGRKYGMALTLDVFSPGPEANGLGAILVLASGWKSDKDMIERYRRFIDPLVTHGYTIFVAVTGSRPKYTIPEIVEDVHRAVRFVRYKGRRYCIDPDQLGLYGLSAGGHLSLLVGFSPREGDPGAEDPVERISSAVQAVADFYGPTDFLNYGEEGRIALGRGVLENEKAAFAFADYDEEAKAFIPVTEQTRLFEIGREISPISHLKPGAPPTLIIHGEVDEAVPLEQSNRLAAKLEEAGVPHRLVTVPGVGHAWEDMSAEVAEVARWFDTHLRHQGKA